MSMKEALFKVKSSLSDYVNQAELGNVIEITRHGKTAAVLIGMQEYKELLGSGGDGFMFRYEKWREQGNLCQEEIKGQEFENLRSKATSSVERYLVW